MKINSVIQLKKKGSANNIVIVAEKV